MNRKAQKIKNVPISVENTGFQPLETREGVSDEAKCCVKLKISSEKPHSQPPPAWPPRPFPQISLCFGKTLSQKTISKNGFCVMFQGRHPVPACRCGEEGRRWARRVWSSPKSLRGSGSIRYAWTGSSGLMCPACSNPISSPFSLSSRDKIRSYSAWRFVISIQFEFDPLFGWWEKMV